MKIAGVLLLAFISLVSTGPVQVSENNIGDIVNVDVGLNFEMSSVTDQTIISVILAALNQTGVVISLPRPQPADTLKTDVADDLSKLLP